MKKLLSAAIAVILALSCTVSAFAATDAASPDEPKTVESITIKKLPDKLVYNDNDVTTSDEGVTSILEMLELEFALALDLTGAEIEATYSDGSVGSVDPSDCTATLIDGFKMGMIYDYIYNQDAETEEEYMAWLNGLMEMIYRDYTVEVEYMGAKDTYTITFEQAEFDPDYPPYDEDSIYEVVSVKNPDKLYYTKDDIEIDEYDDITEYMLPIDYTGMEVVVRNTETGELTTLTFEDYDISYLLVDDIDKKNQTLTVECFEYVTDDINVYNDYVEFSFDIYYNFDKTEPTTPTENQKPATKDTPKKTTPVDNSAVQTGTPTTALILVVLLLSGSAALFFAYRRKIER